MPKFINFSAIVVTLLSGCAGPRLALQWVPPPGQAASVPTVTDKSPPNLLDDIMRRSGTRHDNRDDRRRDQGNVVQTQHLVPVPEDTPLPGVPVGQIRPTPPIQSNMSQFGSIATPGQISGQSSSGLNGQPNPQSVLPATGAHVLPIPQPLSTTTTTIPSVPPPTSSSISPPVSISPPIVAGHSTGAPAAIPAPAVSGSVQGAVRSTPTAMGAALQLGPNDSPLERMLDLTKQIESRDTENQVLQARVRSLEAAAASREDALNESLREVEMSAAEVAKARAEFATLRKEIQALKVKLSQAEQDELETLKLIVEALEKLLQAEGK